MYDVYTWMQRRPQLSPDDGSNPLTRTMSAPVMEAASADEEEAAEVLMALFGSSPAREKYWSNAREYSRVEEGPATHQHSHLRHKGSHLGPLSPGVQVPKKKVRTPRAFLVRHVTSSLDV